MASVPEKASIDIQSSSRQSSSPRLKKWPENFLIEANIPKKGGAGGLPVCLVRPQRIENLDRLHQLEQAAFPQDEAQTREGLRFRIENQPEFFAEIWVRKPNGNAVSNEFDSDPKADIKETAEAGAAQVDEELIGLINGTLTTNEDCLTEESMATHEPAGTVLCIHSVVTAEKWRRRGIQRWALGRYCEERLFQQCLTNSNQQQKQQQLKQIKLICKKGLIDIYSQLGFQMVGESKVVHGKDPWFEMEMKAESC